MCWVVLVVVLVRVVIGWVWCDSVAAISVVVRVLGFASFVKIFVERCEDIGYGLSICLCRAGRGGHRCDHVFVFPALDPAHLLEAAELFHDGVDFCSPLKPFCNFDLFLYCLVERLSLYR